VSGGTASNIQNTDDIMVDFQGDPTATVGYEAGAMLTIIKYASSSSPYVKINVCNNTASSITPGAVTVNWRVVR
jgi:hypothetical protein